MLIEFSAENFKSIRDKVTLSLNASADKKLPKNVAKVNLPQIEKKKSTQRILKSSIIYGANASGKSNIIKAIDIIKRIILYSNKHLQDQKFPIDNFRLDLSYDKKPTNFEFIFVNNGLKYAYQVSLLKERVLEENLYYWPNGRQVKVFERTGQDIVFGNLYEKNNKETELRNKIYAEDTAPNTLFLSMANNVSIPQVKAAYNWFATKLVIMTQQNGIGRDTTQLIADNYIDKQDVLNYLKIADSQIANFKIIEGEVEDLDPNHPMNAFIRTVILPQIAKRENIKIENISKITGKSLDEKTQRYGVNESGQKILIDFNLSDESDGTQRYYGLIGPIISCLKNECTILFDELELRLHPLLSKGVIELFSSDINTNNSQLIMTSHDVNLLNYKDLFRRDQIWFTEKNVESVTELYSLDDFIGIRNSMISSNNYLKGKFGAIPDLNWEIINKYEEKCH